MGEEYAIPVLPNAYDQVPEKLLKGRLLKNNVKNVNGLQIRCALTNSFDRFDVTEQVAPMTARSWKCNPLRGQAGQMSVFVFKYRSRSMGFCQVRSSSNKIQKSYSRSAAYQGPLHLTPITPQSQKDRRRWSKRRKRKIDKQILSCRDYG